MNGLDRMAVIAHELRSPVAALVAIAGEYASSDAATRPRLLSLAAAAAESIDRLLADAEVASLRLERLDAVQLAREVAETAALGGAAIVVDGDPGVILDGDRDRLRQALANLVANAVGHSPAGEAVYVTVRRVGDLVALEVSDQGEGIAAADASRVFEPGVRLTDTRPGAGLGLAVVRSIAVAHGGSVELESSPGRGATFRLVLPGVSAGR